MAGARSKRLPPYLSETGFLRGASRKSGIRPLKGRTLAEELSSSIGMLSQRRRSSSPREDLDVPDRITIRAVRHQDSPHRTQPATIATLRGGTLPSRIPSARDPIPRSLWNSPSLLRPGWASDRFSSLCRILSPATDTARFPPFRRISFRQIASLSF